MTFRQRAELRHIRAAFINRPKGCFDTGAGEFSFHEERSRPMSKTLKRTYHLIELHPRLEVFQRSIKGFRRCAEHFCSQARTRSVENGVQQLKPLIHIPDHGVRADFDVSKHQIGIAAAVRSVQAGYGHPRCVGRHQQQRDAVRVAWRTARSRCDDKHVGARAFKHKHLSAIQRKTLAAASGQQRRLLGGMVRVFVHRKRNDRRTSRNARQPVLLLSFAAAQQQRRSPDQR